MASSILRLTSLRVTLESLLLTQNHVCRTLCSAAMSTIAVKRVAPPWLMLPPSSLKDGDTAYTMYSPSKGKVVRLDQETKSPYPNDNDNPMVVGSSHGWLALYDKRDTSMFLWNPITHRNIELPPLDTLPILKNDCVSKVILSSSPDQGEGDDECLAVMAFDSGLEQTLACCCPGQSNASWNPYGVDFRKRYRDFVYSNRYKGFFCLSETEGKLGFHMEKITMWTAGFYSEISNMGGERRYQIPMEQLRRCYVVYAEHSDQLFVVTRLLGDGAHRYKPVGFNVHKLDYDIDDKIEVLSSMEGSLDGLVMFVGLNHSFVLRAAEFPELKPDSIYFADDDDDDDVGIFDYRNKTISPCYCPIDHVQGMNPGPFWFTPTSHAT